MRCRVCGNNKFTNLFNEVVCDKCGAIYDMEDMEYIKDFEKCKLWRYFKEVIEDIKDEAKREYIKGLFYGYFDTLNSSRWKKAKEWAVIKIVDLLNKIGGGNDEYKQ